MGRNADHYRDQLKELLPPGKVFPRSFESNSHKLVSGAAEEFARVDDRSEQLLLEAIPLTTSELLGEWEGVAGLPDNCSNTLGATLQQRRKDLVAKLTSRGGQSKEYFISVAAALGYTITIEEFRPFRAGMSRAGDSLTNGDWVFTWRIRAPAVTTTHFRAGISRAGEPLAIWGNAGFECRFNQLKPAHTILIFAYGEPILALVGGGFLELMAGGPLTLMSE